MNIRHKNVSFISRLSLANCTKRTSGAKTQSWRRNLLLLLFVFLGISFFINLHFSLLYPLSNHSLYSDYSFLLNSTETLCSQRSTQRGFKQKIISVSAYHSTDNIHLTNFTWQYLSEFIENAREKYPQWIVRVYYFNLDKTVDDILKLELKYNNVDFCNSEHIPILDNIKKYIPGKIQRFLPIIDRYVDYLMVRDIDSPLTDREIDAVNEWLNTTKTYHIMRDNPVHNIPILGGMWGFQRRQNDPINSITNLAKYFLSDNLIEKFSDAGDQTFLNEYIYPLAKHDSIVHDSYICTWSKWIWRMELTRPFPSRRSSPTCFVGCTKPCCLSTKETEQLDLSKYKQCPKRCRPPNHHDWLFC